MRSKSEIYAEAFAEVSRRRQIRRLAIVTPVGLGIMGYAWREFTPYKLGFLPDEALLSFSFILIVLGIGGFFYLYLQGGFDTAREVDQLVRSIREREAFDDVTMAESQLRKTIDEAQHDSRATTISGSTDRGRVAVKDELKSSDFIRLLKEQVDAIQAAKQARTQQEILEECKERLMAEVALLRQRGTYNLLCGGGISAWGIYLIYETLNRGTVAPITDLATFLPQFLPRLTLVVMIELFAYFFLSLHRSGLQEIKYFQNELTNIQTKHAALLVALSGSEATTISQIIMVLANTERNHIISKDQTTVELEKVRIEKTSSNELMKMLTEKLPVFTKPAEK